MPRVRRFHLPNRALLLKIVGGVTVALLVVAFVPPLRRAAAVAISKTVLFVAAPLAPNVADLKKLPETTKLLAVDGSVVAELDKDQRRVPVSLDKLPAHVKQATLAAEDKDFYSHGGIDPDAVMRAFLRTAQGNTQGGSTITQQLAKINYTARERTLLRKLKEVLYASKLEKKYSKDELLERYLNQVYFGEGAYGIAAAAQTYFNVPPEQLTPAQAAMLTGKIRSPEGLNPRKNEKPVLERRNQVLANMRDEGWLKAADFRAAKDSPLDLQPPPPPANNRAPHFVEHVKREASTIPALGSSESTRSSQLYTGGFTIETTFDPKVYDATVESVRQRLGEPGDPFTAVATVVPGDGAVRSLFGGLDFVTSQFDMSSNPASGRQAGSAFKPFVYLASLRDGMDPRSTYDGTSGRVIPCYDNKKPVSNYAGEDLGGKITLDEAMVHSVNVVFVEVGCATGVRDVIRTSVDDGIPEDATKVQGAVFLGGLDDKGVNALEMASAFATFAAQGTYAKPYAIARIKDSKGKVVYEHKPETRPVFRPEEVGVLNNPMQQVVQRGTGTNANIGRPVAGKTGTTQDNVDGWFVGYTPQLATGVWVGYNNNQKMEKVHGRPVTGGSFPAQVFGDVMRAAHEGVPVKQLFVASPDDLNLEMVGTTTTSSSTTTSSTTTTSTTLPGATTLPVTPTTVVPPGRATTTTTARPPTASTTTTSKKQTTTTTTTTTTSSTTTTVAP